jgi:GH15 family glucan-1,4-alpha-glucosidase
MARTPHRIDGYAEIADYALIGDEHSAALIALDGSLDWLCLPSFADPPVFGALLDPERGGAFELAPSARFEAERRYLPGTNVLETTFVTETGTARVLDAMAVPVAGSVKWSEVARRVECVAGKLEFTYRVRPRFDWGARAADVSSSSGATLFRGDGLSLVLQTWDAGEPHVGAGDAAAEFTLAEGGVALMALTAFTHGPLALFRRREIEQRLDETCRYWRSWTSRMTYDGPWRDAVLRSALTLTALVHRPDGGIIAAPTTSLPERLGGDRNYDYRYCWVRDSCLVLEAMLELGYRNQVHSSLTWMLDAVTRTHPRVHVLYGLGGLTAADERECEVRGYRDSRPVRSGNRAGFQLQLGGYGDLLQTVALFAEDGNVIDAATGRMLAVVADQVTRIWRLPDSGMWEIPERRQYAQGKFAAWMALDRAVRLADLGVIDARADQAATWRREAAAVMRFIEDRCWSDRLGAYVQAPERERLDANFLVAVRFGYPQRERLGATVARIRERLCAPAAEPLVYRYEGMREREGAFGACSFGLVEAMARLGQREAAAELMERLLGRANDVGLFAEEIDPSGGAFRGNFPQALSHLALITAAAALRDPGV